MQGKRKRLKWISDRSKPAEVPTSEAMATCLPIPFGHLKETALQDHQLNRRDGARGFVDHRHPFVEQALGIEHRVGRAVLDRSPIQKLSQHTAKLLEIGPTCRPDLLAARHPQVASDVPEDKRLPGWILVLLPRAFGLASASARGRGISVLSTITCWSAKSRSILPMWTARI